MNKKMTFIVAAGVTTGIAIYLISRIIKERNCYARNDKGLPTKPKGTYPYEYSL